MARWDTSTRKSRLPPDWQRRRRIVLERDNYSCTHVAANGHRCGVYANQVHHAVSDDDHRIEALASLCEPHHAKESSSEGHAAQRQRRRLPSEAHPGRIES